MKGLILKDYYNLFEEKKTIFYYIALMFFFTLFTEQYLATNIILYTLVTRAFAFDEITHWDDFVRVLPLKAKNIVLSRYTVIIASYCVSSIFVLALIIVKIKFFNSDLNLQSTLVSFFSSLFGAYISNIILAPVLYRFSTNKAILISFAVFFFIIAIFVAIIAVVYPTIEGNLNDNLFIIVLLMLITVCLLTILSIKVSTRFFIKYRK